jgi:hypothetical protein
MQGLVGVLSSMGGTVVVNRLTGIMRATIKIVFILSKLCLNSNLTAESDSSSSITLETTIQSSKSDQEWFHYPNPNN